jgi:16S rRNA (guanine527-N7)-methyltransferase
VTADPVRDQIKHRARLAGVVLQSAAADQLAAYLDLLTRWNRRINLTSLVLDPPTDESVDRLIVEPLVAVPHLAALLEQRDPDPIAWVDIGSGGGSPAIPMKIVMPRAGLTMVESRGRKTTFLQEAVRSLSLSATAVANQRFEKWVLSRAANSVDLITLRAVRMDEPLRAAIVSVLRTDGLVAIFHAAEPGPLDSFQAMRSVHLPGTGRLTIFRPVFHVER